MHSGRFVQNVAVFLGSIAVLGCSTLYSLAQDGQAYIPGRPIEGGFEDFARPLLVRYCVDCHGAASPEGGLSLEEVGPVDETNAAVWKTIWAQVTLQEMPPQDAEQPAVVERLKLADWIVGGLTRALRDKGGFREHLDPTRANFLDHDLLFGPLPDGIQLIPTASPARLWRVTPPEHMTRLNELINREPPLDPQKPGLRTHGDAVPTNHGGELKLYFGTDRIIKWQGGTVAYATAVKSIPSILSWSRDHGLKNYPDFHTVNSAEATQILSAAEDIIRYMAYGPLSIANPEQITDDPNSYEFDGDLRGLPTSLVYNTKVVRPLTPVYDLMNTEGVSEHRLRAAVDYLFEALTFRPPSTDESDAYLQITQQVIDQLGKEDGAVLGLSSIFLDRDALFRPELAEQGTADQYGRVMLRDWELGLALNHALRYLKPDETLREAILAGRMRTRDDVRRELVRMLNDDSIRKPRILQFFRDYFDYDHGGYICKDPKALAETGVSNRGTAHYRAMFDATASTDRLVELVLQDDRDVLRRLLTTRQVVVTQNDRVYFGKRLSRAEVAAQRAAAQRADAEAARMWAAELDAAEKAVVELEKRLVDAPDDVDLQSALAEKQQALKTIKKRIADAEKRRRAEANQLVAEADLSGPRVFARVSRRSFGNGSMKPERMLATAPEGQRLGILTHPSWLVSHSDAMDNHAIRRGKWIRERLLGGGIPDVPITVDAVLPDEPQSTLRERMRVTRADYCWKCHQKMDPLGLPFEMYNHAGLFRETELERPVDTSGEIIDSGDASLDGPVADAIEMIEKLAHSQRAEQVFVRHAFRFWIGRNETLHDRPVLQDAYRAYRESGGSMKALLTSLLTSDAFLYRQRPLAAAHLAP
ncbi:MAG: DUF1588 domain-containing protein [Planctomycetota bacterium]|nr:MAG: DUF1588 domain-containing protein [Planctomycetota bacterium]